MKIIRNSRGSSAVEFTLILPFAAIILISVFAMSFHGVRGIVAQLSAMRAARVASTFQDEELIQGEVIAALPPNIFRTGSFEIKGTENNAMLELSAFSNSALSQQAGTSALKRDAPLTPALPPNIGNAVLQGGDTTSPYCRGEGGYFVCD